MRPLHVVLGLRGPVLPSLARALADAIAADDPSAPAVPVVMPAGAGVPGPTWDQDGDRVSVDSLPPETTPGGPAGGSEVILVGDGGADPRDLLEGLPAAMATHDLRLARVHLVVELDALATRPRAATWYHLVAHFADTFLLVRPPGVPNKVVSDFQRHLERECHPGLRWVLLPGALPPLPEMLLPEARRLTGWFDSLQWGAAELPAGTTWEIEASAEDEADEGSEDDDDLDDPDREPLFDRDAIGRRVPPLPEP